MWRKLVIGWGRDRVGGKLCMGGRKILGLGRGKRCFEK